MNILLVNPGVATDWGRDLYSARVLGPMFNLRPFLRMSQGISLALPTLAAHTPASHRVQILDEEIETIDFDQPVDLVGITAMTYKAARAYQIAAEFRRRGVRTVMGGIHASMCPDEAREHVDAVVIGEADMIWSNVVGDAEQGRLQERYRAEDFPDLKESKVPDYSRVKNARYLYTYFQTSRGCPFNCNFCTVTKHNGHRLRKKTAEQVITEIDAYIQLRPKRFHIFKDRRDNRVKPLVGPLALIDDNFAADREHALAVANALRNYQDRQGLAIAWFTQVNYTIGFDEELLAAVEAANCRHLFMGFESLDLESLKEMRKRMNSPPRYAAAIANIRRHGIQSIYSTIIGDEHTNRRSVEEIAEFVEAQEIVHVLPNILTPYPGSEIRAAMDQERRIIVHDPSQYNVRNVVYQPKNLSPAELEGLFAWLMTKLFNYRAVLRRGRSMLGRSDPLVLPWLRRILALPALQLTAVILFLRGRLRGKAALRVIFGAPAMMLRFGSLFALELIAVSADYDDYATSEARRFRKRKANWERTPQAPVRKLDPADADQLCSRSTG